jgi:hypothetical protein
MSSWEAYIDESGQFGPGPHTRLVGAVVWRLHEPFAGEALRLMIQERYPWWVEFPLHATEFRRPITHVLRWHTAGRPTSPDLQNRRAWESAADTVFDRSFKHRAQVVEWERAWNSKQEGQRGEVRRLEGVLEFVTAPLLSAALKSVDQDLHRMRSRIASALNQHSVERNGFFVLAAPAHAAIESSYTELLADVVARSAWCLNAVIADRITETVRSTTSTDDTNQAELTVDVLQGHLGQHHESKGRYCLAMQSRWPDFRPRNYRLNERVTHHDVRFTLFHSGGVEHMAADWVCNGAYGAVVRSKPSLRRLLASASSAGIAPLALLPGASVVATGAGDPARDERWATEANELAEHYQGNP